MIDFKCYLCGNSEYKQRAERTRDNPSVFPVECTNCGLVTLSSFEHINANYYAESHMHDAKKWDAQLELAQGEEDSSRRCNFVQDLACDRNVLDIGCGAGGFLLKIRNIAKNVIGVEPEKRLQEHFKKFNLVVHQDVKNVSVEYPDVITMFHVLEHLPDPIKFLKEIRKRFFLERQLCSLVVEVPSASDALITLYDCSSFKEFTYWSCHLFLFTQETLKAVAAEAGFKIVEVHQVQRYPLANHLYWLAKGKPGGQKMWNFFNEKRISAEYETVLKELNACDTITAVLR